MTRLHTATTVMLSAIRFYSILQPIVRGCAHVAIRSTTVDHGSAPTPRKRLPIDTHLRQANVVETGVPLHGHPLNRPCVIRRIVAANDYNAAPICKAQRENRGFHVFAVGEKLVQQCFSSRARTDPKNTVGPLSVEEIVLILMATHWCDDCWIALVAVANPNIIGKPVAADGRPLGVALVIRAMPSTTASRATSPTILPPSGRTFANIEGRVNVRATMATTRARKSTNAAASVDYDRNTLRRCANKQIDKIVSKVIYVAINARCLDVFDRVVDATTTDCQ